jgi:hypothetical protein
MRSLLASVVAVAGLSAGCWDGKSDGQIPASPEASKAAEAFAKNYGESMIKQHSGKMPKKP